MFLEYMTATSFSTAPMVRSPPLPGKPAPVFHPVAVVSFQLSVVLPPVGFHVYDVPAIAEASEPSNDMEATMDPTAHIYKDRIRTKLLIRRSSKDEQRKSCNPTKTQNLVACSKRCLF